MQIVISAPKLNEPTFITLEEYANKRFPKVEKLLKKKDDSSYEMRVSVDKVKDDFELKADLYGGPIKQNVKVKDKDLRKTVDLAVDLIIKNIVESENKQKSKKNKGHKIIREMKRLAGGFWG